MGKGKKFLRKGVAVCALVLTLAFTVLISADVTVQAGESGESSNQCNIRLSQNGFELDYDGYGTYVYLFQGETITLDIGCDHSPDTEYYLGALLQDYDDITYSLNGTQLTISAAEDAETGYLYSHVLDLFCGIDPVNSAYGYDYSRAMSVIVVVCEKSGTYGDVQYSYDSDIKVLTISGSGEMRGYTAGYLIPWYAAWISAESVVIEDGVTGYIYGGFAGFVALKEIYIPEGILCIREGVFEGCSSLETIYYGGSVVGWEEILDMYYSETFEGIDIVYSRKADISTEAEISHKDVYAYTGSEITPVTVENTAGTVLEEGVDYTVSYSDNIELGTATVTVTGIGNYTGTVTDTFIIAESASNVLCYDPETGLLRYVNSVGNFSDSYTGISSYDGSRYYVEDGIVTMTTTGLVEVYDDSYYYIVNSKVVDVYGLYEIDGTLYFLWNGKFLDYENCIESYDGITYYVEDGIVTMTTTGVVYVYGIYYYVVNSEVVTSAGLYKSDGVWYYVNSYGVVDYSYTGLAKNDYGWWYVTEGILDTSYTGMAKNAYGWWYVTDGKLDTSYTGLASNDYGTWYMVNGALASSVSGLTKVGSAWIYLTNGMVNTSYTGLADNDYGTWYINAGYLDTSVSGMTKAGSTWVYLTNGMVDMSYTGLAKNVYGWWYINTGYLDLTYTGMAKNAYGWWYVTDGKLDLTYTGMAKNAYGWWYMTNGQLDTSYTGLAENDYGTWYMVNGKLTYYTGTVTIGGVNYTVVNGKVTS